jgi:hypothetical protein
LIQAGKLTEKVHGNEDVLGCRSCGKQKTVPRQRHSIADTQLLRKGQEEAINDRRLAESIYRAAVASGIMERVKALAASGPSSARTRL